MEIKVNYHPTKPTHGDAPKITIYDNINNKYFIKFIDKDQNKTLFSGLCGNNQTIIGERQWFTNWLINVYDQYGKLIFKNEFDPKNKKIFIKLDAYALGDNIAWIPYVEEFRKKYSATVICSTFWNNLFSDAYPDILFVKPNTQITNTYAQVYIGANNLINKKYSPISVSNNPLQKIATSILNLKYTEIKPKISPYLIKNNNYDTKYVTLSEFGSGVEKMWKHSWQTIVNYLNNKGYKVIVISKEKTNLQNIIDKTGDIPIEDRVNDIYHASAHLGVSSGLSWLSWALDTHTVMISDYTPYYHEYQTNITRLGTNKNGDINYEINEVTPIKNVIENIDKIIT